MQNPIPKEFLDYASQLLDDEHMQRFAVALEQSAETSIRLNPMKSKALINEDTFSQREDVGGKVKWSTSAFYLNERPPFTFDPLLHAGVYYVQEASSMFLEQALRTYVSSPVVALDLCAAPGGKSTLIRSLLPQGSLLVSNEPIRARAQVLAENMVKWGHPDVVVTNNYPDDFSILPACFDLIVTDVPCSGEGMFRKEEDARKDWSMQAVEVCRNRQREILSSIWPCLREGGLLVYSTCTLNALEDEENVDWIARELGADVLPITTQQEWGVLDRLPEGSAGPSVYHFVQGMARGEGFFLAVLRKHGTSASMPDTLQASVQVPQRGKTKVKGNQRAQEPRVPAECVSWVDDVSRYAFKQHQGDVIAYASLYASFVERMLRSLKVMQCGITLATLKGRDYVPAHSLALSVARAPQAFPQVELTYEQALAYLRRESIMLPATVQRGYVLVSYRGATLGFVKNLGSRANNLYPQEWRIRSTYTQPYCIMGTISAE